MPPNGRHSSRMLGVSLIELMIAMLLGLLVSSAAIGVFLSNRETFRATENLSRIQENARLAFELMVRDIREAGGNPCGRGLPVANVLNNAGTTWWATWGNAIVGHENGSLAGSASGTDAIEVLSGFGTGLTVANHQPQSATFFVNQAHDLVDGDILMVCDFAQATIFQISNVNTANLTVVHNTGASVSPGNASAQFPNLVTGTGNYCYAPTAGAQCAVPASGPAAIVRMRAVRWFIADNTRSTRSLFRAVPTISSGAASVTTQEIADGVQDMQISYLPRGETNYVAATAITDWSSVIGVRITLTLNSPELAGTGGAPLQRTFQHTIALRNRS